MPTFTHLLREATRVLTGRRLVWALAAALSLNGCSIDVADQNESDIILVVTEVGTESGDENETAAFLLSDVDPNFNDNGILSVRNTPKNATVPTQSNYSDVVMERYTVRFFRSDGLNTEGVDVPYAFQGPLGGIIPAGEEAEVAFVLVRHSAKDEPPLNQMVGSGGISILATFAEVTIYGRTLAGKVVSATVTINVTFADFGD